MKDCTTFYTVPTQNTAQQPAISELENDGTQVMSIDTWRALATNAKVAGVYAVMDISRQTQYIGYSRNILLSINGHIAQNGAENCAFLRVQTFKFPKREEMESGGMLG
jgi:hypothetical protein